MSEIKIKCISHFPRVTKCDVFPNGIMNLEIYYFLNFSLGDQREVAFPTKTE